MNFLTLGNYLGSYLIIGAFLFSMGIYGLLRRRSLIGMLIATELVLSGASVNFMAFNRFVAPNPAVGQIFTLFIMGIAAAEAAIALSIILAVYRNYRSIDTADLADLEG